MSYGEKVKVAASADRSPMFSELFVAANYAPKNR
jgi:hypothetical protein